MESRNKLISHYKKCKHLLPADCSLIELHLGCLFKKNTETDLIQSNVSIFSFVVHASWVLLEKPSLPERVLRGNSEVTKEGGRWGGTRFLGCLAHSPLRRAPHMSVLYFGLLYDFALKKLSCSLKKFLLNMVVFALSFLSTKTKRERWWVT